MPTYGRLLADTSEQSDAVGGRVLQDEWFRDDDDDDGVNDADSGGYRTLYH